MADSLGERTGGGGGADGEDSELYCSRTLAFLKAEWRVLAVFAVIVAGLLAYLGTLSGKGEVSSHPLIGVAFLVGAVTSALAGILGCG